MRTRGFVLCSADPRTVPDTQFLGIFLVNRLMSFCYSKTLRAYSLANRLPLGSAFHSFLSVFLVYSDRLIPYFFQESLRLPWLWLCVSQWFECWAVNQRVTGSIPSQAHAWVVGQVLSRGSARGNHTLMFLYLSFFFPSPLSKNKF